MYPSVVGTQKCEIGNVFGTKNFTFRNSKAVAIKQLIEGWASQGVEDISSCIGNVSIKVNGEMSLEAKKGSPVEISSASQKLWNVHLY